MNAAIPQTYIVAEAGSNHDGKLDQARKLIEVAAQAGADAAKFQCKMPLKREWLPELMAYADECGIDCFFTPFDVESVGLLDALDVPYIKIASAEIVNVRLIDMAAQTLRPLIVSTGMASMSEIGDALYRIAGRGGVESVTLLHCTARYPTPPEQANLEAMATMRDKFGRSIGLSDHTLGIAIPIAATALGASMIEKHFTLDHTRKGPDHAFALEPYELTQMIRGIREVEQAMGDGRKDGPVEGERTDARGRTLTWS